ncbi:MAG TPA: oxidoreductase, partial [Chloroflexota bacterium]
MISGAICQTALMQGMANAVVCDIRVEAAVRAYEFIGFKREDVLVAEAAGAANDAIRRGRPVVTQNSHLVPELEVDCVVEGTG